MTLARFRSTEDAALSGWRQAPSAGARATQVTVCGQRAEVVVASQPGYREWVLLRPRARGLADHGERQRADAELG